MNELTDADMIWNRICGEATLRVLPGDRALVDSLYAHGLAKNGGVLHAVECMTAEELSYAEAGYRYYGLSDVASLLARAREIFETEDDLGSHQQQLDDKYVEFFASNRSLDDRLKKLLKLRPSDFAFLRAKDLDSSESCTAAERDLQRRFHGVQAARGPGC